MLFQLATCSIWPAAMQKDVLNCRVGCRWCEVTSRRRLCWRRLLLLARAPLEVALQQMLQLLLPSQMVICQVSHVPPLSSSLKARACPPMHEEAQQRPLHWACCVHGCQFLHMAGSLLAGTAAGSN